MEIQTKKHKVSRNIYFSLSILFACCVVTQFYFAGVAIFTDAGAWMKHISFVHLFGFNLPLFMLIFAMLGRLPKLAYAQILGIFICIFFMYFTANVRGQAPWIGPLHVMIAILLVILSCLIIATAWKVTIKNEERKELK